jgi:hypothetical protein
MVSSLFTFTPSEVINVHFETMGYTSSSLLFNLDTSMLLLLAIFAASILALLFNVVIAKNSK